MDTKRSTNERETNTRLGFTFVSFAIFCGTGFKFLCAFCAFFAAIPACAFASLRESSSCSFASIRAPLRVHSWFPFAVPFSRLFNFWKGAQVLYGRFQRNFKHLGGVERPVRVAKHLAS